MLKVAQKPAGHSPCTNQGRIQGGWRKLKNWKTIKKGPAGNKLKNINKEE